MKNIVLIKWVGSKRIQAADIINNFPRQINTYYEPFLGGGSILYALLCSDIKVSKYVCSDINKPLIDIYKKVQTNPDELCETYNIHHNALKTEGKTYYYKIRNQFNQCKDSNDFFFLLRTCRNGLVRYNKKGEFNSGFHFKRDGTKPTTVTQIIKEWHNRLDKVVFEVGDYRAIQSVPGDFVYLDPPYASTDEFYFGMIEFSDFWNWVRKQDRYALSLNGFKDKIDCRIDVPEDVYNQHILISNGLNKFNQINKHRVEAHDSLYLKDSHETSNKMDWLQKTSNT